MTKLRGQTTSPTEINETSLPAKPWYLTFPLSGIHGIVSGHCIKTGSPRCTPYVYKYEEKGIFSFSQKYEMRRDLITPLVCSGKMEYEW